MVLTKKQTEVFRKEMISQLSENRITLHYNNQLLDDLRTDLKSEVADLTKLIAKGKARIKKVEVKITENGGRFFKLKGE